MIAIFWFGLLYFISKKNQNINSDKLFKCLHETGFGIFKTLNPFNKNNPSRFSDTTNSVANVG